MITPVHIVNFGPKAIAVKIQVMLDGAWVDESRVFRTDVCAEDSITELIHAQRRLIIEEP